MSKINKVCLLFLLTVVLAGCSSITNLTPSQYPRDPAGYYRVETMWRSKKRVIVPDSFRPMVVVDGFQDYPMRQVPLVQDRWEAFIPVSADKSLVHYHYKFDFMDYSFGKPKADSQMSASYSLVVK